jgi:hypothetical protein
MDKAPHPNAIRCMAKKSIDTLKKECIIRDNHTGKIFIEVNVSQGNVTDVKVLSELKA